MFHRRLLLRISVMLTLPLVCSCSSLVYYGQSISGQLQLLRAQRDFSDVYADNSIPGDIKDRLRRISEIRHFASAYLLLPENDSYLKYADIGRRYIVWNVFATPELSLSPHQSCFYIVGCLSYRGYFHREDAVSYMNQLQNKGFDVYLGGVSAYSTLGWFNDPILNGMLERSDIELARLIFHELAHQRLYLRDDTEFNEAFAEAVAQIGVDAWMNVHDSGEARKEFTSGLSRENQFNELVLSYRNQLESLYSSDLTDEQKLKNKQMIIATMQLDYRKLRESWGGNGEYDNWMKEINNAKIAAVSTYQSLVPDFMHFYRLLGEDLDKFYTQTEALADCSKTTRRKILVSKNFNGGCSPGDTK